LAIDKSYLLLYTLSLYILNLYRNYFEDINYINHRKMLKMNFESRENNNRNISLTLLKFKYKFKLKKLNTL